MGYSLAHHGRTARTLFNLLPPSKRGLVRRGKGGHQSSYPLVHGRIKTFTSKINGVWVAQWWEDGAFKRVRTGCALVNFAFYHSRRMDCAEQKIWWRGLCVGR